VKASRAPFNPYAPSLDKKQKKQSSRGNLDLNPFSVPSTLDRSLDKQFMPKSQSSSGYMDVLNQKSQIIDQRDLRGSKVTVDSSTAAENLKSAAEVIQTPIRIIESRERSSTAE